MIENGIELDNWPWNYGYRRAKGKLNIYYSAEAYAKTISLIQARDLEIGWDMIIKPYKDGYKVEDVLVYPQLDSAAYVHVDLVEYGLWKANLDFETELYMKGNGHSHVNMESFASIVDIKQQHGEVLTRKNGFCLFQIWNKRTEIVSFFYDITNKVFYGNNEINIIIEFADSNSEKFLSESMEIAKEYKAIYPANTLEEFDEFKQVF